MPQRAAIKYSERRDIPVRDIVRLYRANGWSSADKPTPLRSALHNSDTLLPAWLGAELLGLGNAISDGYLVVYYPHLLVTPRASAEGDRHRTHGATNGQVSELSSAHTGCRRQGGRVLSEVRFHSCRQDRAHVDLCWRLLEMITEFMQTANPWLQPTVASGLRPLAPAAESHR